MQPAAAAGGHSSGGCVAVASLHTREQQSMAPAKSSSPRDLFNGAVLQV